VGGGLARVLGPKPRRAGGGSPFVRLAEESIRKQREIEAADEVPFETYRQRYLSHESLRV